MKTAILMSGQPREVAETWPSFMKYMYPNFPNPDVFIYTSQEYNVPEFLEAIRPKKYVVEPQFVHEEAENILRTHHYNSEGHINPVIQQMYGLKKAWELMRQYEGEVGIRYDIVIRTRPDILYINPITPDIADLSGITSLHNESDPKMQMEFCLGPRDEMELYMNVYGWLLHDGGKHLTKDNPRIATSGKLYDSDSILGTYLFDCVHAKRGRQKLPLELPSPYCFYRIMWREKDGSYAWFDRFKRRPLVAISHRGNLDGPNSERENTKAYILEALHQGFDVEMDVWSIDGRYYLGHDKPGEEVDLLFLKQDKFWCHAKNQEALHAMLPQGIHCFYHDGDEVTLTSKGVPWTLVGKPTFPRSVCLMPEVSGLEPHPYCHGVCTDYPRRYKSAD